MALVDVIKADVRRVITQPWNVRDGQVVPWTDNVLLAGGAVKLRATFLYADLARSTELAANFDPRIVAKVARGFLSVCSRVIRANKGQIRSFDGDRVMAIFVGDYKNTNAARCGLKIKYSFGEILKPQFETKYPVLRNFSLSYGVGIDTSDVLAVRAGIRNNNDLVWIGRAPNIAAKLSALREDPYNTIVTIDVYKKLAPEAKFDDATGGNLWEARSWGGGVNEVYISSWYWKP